MTTRFEHVEDGRRGPTADRHIGDGGVQRMADGDTVQQVLDALAGGTGGGEGILDQLFADVLDWLQPILLIHQG